MVKIVNPLGDVKIGRQGEVVYQRKYGQQIRRQASPKRAIPSQSQIDHRQLYRAALTWRSQLSLANRRYLDGYCIASWVVDGYNIPLVWSRFALKLYLEAVKFTVIEKAVAGEEGGQGRFEWYDDVQALLAYRLGHWGAQTFTPSVSHQISKVRLRCWRNVDQHMGDVIVSIKATDGEGKPTGDDIVAVAEPSLNIGIVQAVWHDFIFATNPTLAAETKYAIVLRVPTAGAGEQINVSRRYTDPAYEGGQMCDSTNAGVSWDALAQDWTFEEYGAFPGIEAIPGLIHVKHPSLLTVVQKRGELTIKGYDTLSSLDEEYLTKQVGLDVDSGDLIQVTTLPGIEYAHLVS